MPHLLGIAATIAYYGSFVVIGLGFIVVGCASGYLMDGLFGRSRKR